MPNSLFLKHPYPTHQKAKWLLSAGPGPENYQCGCYSHIPSSSKSLYSFLYHTLFHYPCHCSRPWCFLYYPFTPRLSRPLCLYLDWPNYRSQQLTGTVLPLGSPESPHFFGQALASDLTSLDLTPSTVLQYVDNLLLVVLHLHTLNNTLYTTLQFSSWLRLLSISHQGSALSS